MAYCSIYITAPAIDAAIRIGRLLVEERLAACANVIDGVRSIYRWGGEVVEDAEAAVIVKTRQALFEAVSVRVREIHDYTVPCIVAWAIVDGTPDYLAWIDAETRPGC
jgi:periplasmic divalent cation tolerance protein